MHKEWQVACLLCSNMTTMCLEYTDYSILRLKKHLLKRELRGQNQFSVIGRYFSQGLVFHSSEEKMESIADNQNYLEWCDEEIRSLTAVRFFLTFINDIISIAESYENSCYTIWAGVEAYPPNEEEDT